MNTQLKFQLKYALNFFITLLSFYHSLVFSQDIKHKNLNEFLVFTDEEMGIELKAILTNEHMEEILKRLLEAKNNHGGLKEYFKYIWSPTVNINDEKYTEEVIEEMLKEKINKALENTQKNVGELKNVGEIDDKKPLNWISFEAVKKSTNTPIGMTTLHVNEGDAYPSVGIYVYPKLSGKGDGTKIITTLLNYHATFFEDPTLGWDCYASNTGSVALAKKFGFSPIKEVVEAMGLAIYYTKINQLENPSKTEATPQ